MSDTASRASASLPRSSAKNSVSAAWRTRSFSESVSFAGPTSSRVRITRPYACDRSEVICSPRCSPVNTGHTHEIDQCWLFFMSRWLVDGMNVVGSTPDGWWRDRRGAMKRLAESLAAYASRTGEQITVVFDGKPFEVDAAPVEVAFAPDADDDIERIVARDPEPAGFTVVTSDRALAGRVRSHGASVFPARAFREKL